MTHVLRHTMLTIEDIRRENGRDLIRTHGLTPIAQLLGHGSPSTLSQIFGPNPTRQPTEKLVRRMELVLNLKPLALDTPPAPKASHLQVVPPAPVAPPPVSGVTADTVALAIQLAGEILEDEHVSLTPRRFAEFAMLAHEDALEHGGTAREKHLRQIARLLK